jgi:hypothetical protein
MTSPARALREPRSADRSDPAGEPRPAGVARDRSIDVMRGVAILLMVMSHVGPGSHITTLAHLPLWISAAEPFFFLSGLVLGIISGPPLRDGRARAVYRKIGRRAYELWVVHCVLTALTVIVHELTGRMNVPSVAAAGGWVRVAWMIPALRFQPVDYMNILPLFVVFFAVSPLVFELLRRRQTLLVAGASLALWAAAQWRPELIPFADPVCGTPIFSVAAWQLVFFSGVLIGYHRDFIARELWPKHGRTIAITTGVVTLAIFMAAQLQRGVFARFGVTFPPSSAWLFAKPTSGPVRTAYDGGMFMLAYLALARTERSTRGRAVREGVEMLGRKSLYCFVVHLAFALPASAFTIQARSSWLQDAATALAILGLYALARRDVGARFLPR